MQENTNMLLTKQKSLLSFRFLSVHTRNTEVHLALSLHALIVTGMIKDVILARMLWRFKKKMQKKLLRKLKRRSSRRRQQILDPQGASKKPKPSPLLLLDRKIKSKRRKRKKIIKRKKSQKWSKKLFHKIDNVKAATDISLHLKSKRNMDFANSIRSLVK